MAILGVIVVAVLVVAAVVAFKLWKSGKAVTGSSVVQGVEADVKSAAASAEAAVKTEVTDVSKKV